MEDQLTKATIARIANELMGAATKAPRGDVAAVVHANWVALLRYGPAMPGTGSTVWVWFFDTDTKQHVADMAAEGCVPAVDHDYSVSQHQAAWKAAWLAVQFNRGTAPIAGPAPYAPPELKWSKEKNCAEFDDGQLNLFGGNK